LYNKILELKGDQIKTPLGYDIKHLKKYLSESSFISETPLTNFIEDKFKKIGRNLKEFINKKTNEKFCNEFFVYNATLKFGCNLYKDIQKGVNIENEKIKEIYSEINFDKEKSIRFKEKIFPLTINNFGVFYNFKGNHIYFLKKEESIDYFTPYLIGNISVDGKVCMGDNFTKKNYIYRNKKDNNSLILDLEIIEEKIISSKFTIENLNFFMLLEHKDKDKDKIKYSYLNYNLEEKENLPLTNIFNSVYKVPLYIDENPLLYISIIINKNYLNSGNIFYLTLDAIKFIEFKYKNNYNLKF
ncbi:hypothetical protein V6O07_04615, partial [Arthrospira platensis SPKY2]